MFVSLPQFVEACTIVHICITFVLVFALRLCLYWYLRYVGRDKCWSRGMELSVMGS